MADSITRLRIEGFKSIRKLEFEPRSLNVLIGQNGAGKSNFVSLFRLLRELVEQRLQTAVRAEGGADACLYMGPKITPALTVECRFGRNEYLFELAPTPDNGVFFRREVTASLHDGQELHKDLGSGHIEAKMKDRKDKPGTLHKFERDVYFAISRWTVYHFDDTSPMAGVRRQGPIIDNESLRPDGRNLAAFLLGIRDINPPCYHHIREVIRLAAPFFDDFHLRPVPVTPDLIQLEWRQKNSDYPFAAHQLSDGTLRFACLATALLQPNPPATMLFDEPELGLHPYALSLLGNLFKQAEQNGTQLIVSTQSPLLINEFLPEDIVIVERHESESVFRRLEPADLREWLEEYSLGELWQKNVLGGRPRVERPPAFAGDKEPIA